MHIYDYSLLKRDGSQLNLSDYAGKILLIVNTATGCGFTPQYEGLESLYKKYHAQGLEILDIPCDQFGHQAPGTDDEIHSFCTAKYQTSFDQLAKSEVNGENELALYTFLKSQISSDTISWLKNKVMMQGIRAISSSCQKEEDIVRNFTKFLVDRQGNIVQRYCPTYNPTDMEQTIQKLL